MAEDYETKPLFVSSKENRLLYVLAGAGAAAAPGAAGGGTGTPNRRIEAPVVSDADEGAEIISPNHNQTSPSLELETLADPSSEDV